jgi:hypothetical protein
MIFILSSEQETIMHYATRGRADIYENRPRL